MCDVCVYTPCLSRCPNAPKPPVIEVCSGCMEDIVLGEDYYQSSDIIICSRCVFDMTGLQALEFVGADQETSEEVFTKNGFEKKTAEVA